MDFKKTLLIACLFVGLNTVAQNRLEFNQVVTIDTNYTSLVPYGNWTYYDNYYYVPVGTVWKIESHSAIGGANLEINDIEIQILHYAGSNQTQSVAINNVFPIWLKSGDKIRYRWNGSCTSQNSCYATHKFFISIIEFNIITD